MKNFSMGPGPIKSMGVKGGSAHRFTAHLSSTPLASGRLGWYQELRSSTGTTNRRCFRPVHAHFPVPAGCAAAFPLTSQQPQLQESSLLMSTECPPWALNYASNVIGLDTEFIPRTTAGVGLWVGYGFHVSPKGLCSGTWFSTWS